MDNLFNQQGGIFMKTILIVDDEKRIRSVYGKMLCREGYNIFKAENAEEAHELLMRTNVDLVLLDINMPSVKGSVFYEIIQEFFKKTKVIVASVYPLEDQQILIQGADEYYDKSDSIEELIQKVHAVLFDYPKNILEACSEKKQA
jgi:two-component system phosphate regulon response regulator PhoB